MCSALLRFWVVKHYRSMIYYGGGEMDETIFSQPEPRTKAEAKAILAQLFAEMDRLDEQMRQDGTEIERLKLETAALKAEAQRLKNETRATLARMGVTL